MLQLQLQQQIQSQHLPAMKYSASTMPGTVSAGGVYTTGIGAPVGAVVGVTVTLMGPAVGPAVGPGVAANAISSARGKYAAAVFSTVQCSDITFFRSGDDNGDRASALFAAEIILVEVSLAQRLQNQT